jgi:hypothetical protein
MDDRTNAFDLSPEQQDTESLLRRLLGNAIADRYFDFCRLSAGAFRIEVSRPLAAHALRELDSTLRHVLAVPMEAKNPDQVANADQLDEARRRLSGLDFDDAAIRRAIESLKPRLSHKTQIRKIVARLGLDPEGDVANRWTSLNDSFGKAHERSFHRSLEVDDEFRSRYQQPFDTVIRAVAVALEGRYTALMQRVEEIAAMPNRAQAVTAFASEIPGALPLQWHFFKSLSTGDWLPHLAKKGLLGEPLSRPQQENRNGFRSRQWPAGNYLQTMAASPDTATRKLVAEALREVATSKHPDIQHDGIEVLAALPAEESAPLADLAVSWLGREARYAFLQAPEKLVKKLAEAGQGEAALGVARALLQVWNENGEIASLYGRHMYEHHLPAAMQVLTKACGEDALRLFMELLRVAADISGKIQYDHHSSRSLADDEMANADIYGALMSAVRKSAGMLITEDPTRMRNVIGILTADPAKIFVRVALLVLARNPAAAPDLAEAYLLDSELIEQTWAQKEYAALALAWFPSLSPEKQRAILAVVDAMPSKYREDFRAGFHRNHRVAPTADDERIFEAITLRDTMWKWRSVLPSERREAVEQIVAEHGDPDAWRHRLFPPQESPMDAAEFSSRTVPDVIAFLKAWRPSKGEQQRQTVTAFAQALRTAVENDPKTFAINADQFAGAKPIYVRRLLEGLQNAASNRRGFEWGNVLKLIEHTLGQHDQAIDPATLDEGDDKSWGWACMSASELVAAGLRQGAKGIAFEQAALVRNIVLGVLKLAPKHPEVEDFETRFHRSPYFAAQATLRGAGVELCVLLTWWLSRDASGPIGLAPRDALENLPDIREALDAQLRDRTLDGRIPRAIMGRYLRYLFYFGEPWLKAVMPALIAADDNELRHAAWLSHLGHDEGPLSDLMTELRGCYADTIARLSAEDSDRDFRDLVHDRLADYVMILHLWDALPGDLLEQFEEHAPDSVRQHAMSFVGTQVSRPPSEVPDHVKARGLKYWERRLTAAIKSGRPDNYRQELGAISWWCFNGQVDEEWMCEQLLRMLAAGFVPNDAYGIIEWLEKIAQRHIDRAVPVMAALLRNGRIDQWAYMTKREPIRAVLGEGLAKGTPETSKRANEIIGFLSSIGETSYLDLVRRAAG